MRERVKRALIDLQIFIEFADKGDVNQVLTRETLTPLVDSLLPILNKASPIRAEIAQLFIEKGFECQNT